MTTPGFSQREITALAALTASVRQRAVPDRPWGEAGIVQEIRRNLDVPLAGLAWALLRAACDPANDTPAALSQDGNRAWEDDLPWRCDVHPRAGRRTNGDCGGCYADRRASSTPGVIADRGGVPMPAEARAAVAAVLHRARQRPVSSAPVEVVSWRVPSGTGWPTESRQG